MPGTQRGGFKAQNVTEQRLLPWSREMGLVRNCLAMPSQSQSKLASWTPSDKKKKAWEKKKVQVQTCLTPQSCHVLDSRMSKMEWSLLSEHLYIGNLDFSMAEQGMLYESHSRKIFLLRLTFYSNSFGLALSKCRSSISRIKTGHLANKRNTTSRRMRCSAILRCSLQPFPFRTTTFMLKAILFVVRPFT